MISYEERQKEVNKLRNLSSVPSYELVPVHPSDLMKWAELIEHPSACSVCKNSKATFKEW